MGSTDQSNINCAATNELRMKMEPFNWMS